MTASISNSNIDNLNIFNNTSPILSKICTNCNQNKQLTEYHKDKSTADRYRHVCKSCRSNINNHYRDNNRQINANKIYTENDIKICSKCKQQKLYTEFYKNATKKLGLESYCKQCELNDQKEYFRRQFCQAINKAIKNNNYSCLPLTGCDPHFLKLWIEFQFDENMNWGNYGTYFHIDHVKSFSLFNIEDDNNKRLINHWNNLTPLENMTKRNKYSDEIELNHTTKILRFLDYLSKYMS